MLDNNTLRISAPSDSNSSNLLEKPNQSRSQFDSFLSSIISLTSMPDSSIDSKAIQNISEKNQKLSSKISERMSKLTALSQRLYYNSSHFLSIPGVEVEANPANFKSNSLPKLETEDKTELLPLLKAIQSLENDLKVAETELKEKKSQVLELEVEQNILDSKVKRIENFARGRRSMNQRMQECSIY
jgi:hypothetical protein